MGKWNKLRCIVRFRQMLRSWRLSCRRFPSDVPAGHVAICVGSSCRRFIVRLTHLNHPIFRLLLSQAAEEYGFDNISGPLALPCDEMVFEEILRFVALGERVCSRCCHFGIENDPLGESRPLLRGLSILES